jgi:hypothetical protein
MIEDKRLLTEVEAQQIAEKFLLAKHFDSKINFSSCQLIATDDSRVYQLRGELTMRSRSSFSRFTGPESANKYVFRIEIDAQQGQIINYEII